MMFVCGMEYVTAPSMNYLRTTTFKNISVQIKKSQLSVSSTQRH